MAKDPAFLFYTNDFSTGTQFFTDDQLGKYLRLLMAQHQHGHLTDKQVLNICKTYDEDVMKKFIKDANGLYFNERLEIEIDKRKRYCNSRRENKTSKTYDTSYDEHMENRNKDEDLFNRGHEVFLEKLLSEKGLEDKQAIELMLTKKVNKTVLSEFNAHLKFEKKQHVHYSEWLKHFRNWYKLQKREANHQTAEGVDDFHAKRVAEVLAKREKEGKK